MKALCVTATRDLEVRDVSLPTTAVPGHVLVDMAAAAINPGDKTFLKMRPAGAGVVTDRRDDVWGASGAGTVVAIGDGVPAAYLGKQVALYRSLGRTPESVGLWCERAHVPATSCLILPDEVDAREYAGSLVNVITAYAFLDEIEAAGHRGVIVTAGNSATGLALAALARRRKLPAIFLVRSEDALTQLERMGVEHVIVTDEGYTDKLAALAAALKTTAVFDGVGGALIGAIAPNLPMNATIYFYGFLDGATPFAVPSMQFMLKNLTMRPFSNFASRTVTEPARLQAALAALERVIADPMFRTRLRATFSYAQIAAAMAYRSDSGAKAILAL